MKLNLGNEGDPKEVFINATLPTSFQAQIKELLVNYCDFLPTIIRILREYARKLVVNANQLSIDNIE
jgi:hypothetical protein